MQPSMTPSQQQNHMTPSHGTSQRQGHTPGPFLDAAVIAPHSQASKNQQVQCFVMQRFGNDEQEEYNKHVNSMIASSRIQFNQQFYNYVGQQAVEQAHQNTQMGGNQNIGIDDGQKESSFFFYYQSEEQQAQNPSKKPQIMQIQHNPSQLANQVANQCYVKIGSQKLEAQGQPLGSNSQQLHNPMLKNVNNSLNYGVIDHKQDEMMKSKGLAMQPQKSKVPQSQQQIQVQQKLQNQSIYQSGQHHQISQQSCTNQYSGSQSAIKEPFSQSSIKPQPKQQSKFNNKGGQEKENDK